jgi:hypothetical protein
MLSCVQKLSENQHWYILHSRPRTHITNMANILPNLRKLSFTGFQCGHCHRNVSDDLQTAHEENCGGKCFTIAADDFGSPQRLCCVQPWRHRRCVKAARSSKLNGLGNRFKLRPVASRTPRSFRLPGCRPPAQNLALRFPEPVWTQRFVVYMSEILCKRGAVSRRHPLVN